MQHRRRALLGLALTGGMGRLLKAGAQTPPRAPTPAGLAQLDRELAAIAANPACELASLSAVAVRNGRISYKGHFGKRHFDAGGGQPVNDRTLFRIASISKMMTTLGLMRLVEQGKLDLDADVSTYLGFPLRNPHFKDQPIILRHLLSHRSSLRDAAGYSWGPERALRDILVPGAPYHGKGEMWGDNAAPGDYFIYCNLGFGVVGTIMERVTGERFDRLMKRLLLDPLGLHGGYNPAQLSNEDLGNLATLYRKRTVDTEVWDPNGPWIAQADDYSGQPPREAPGMERYVIGSNATPFSPTGGLRISAADLARVMLMLVNQGAHEGQSFLRPETLKTMFTRQWLYDGVGHNGNSNDGLFYCWGLANEQFFDQPGTGRQVVEGGGFSGVGHLGDAYGLMSVFIVDLAKGNGMVAIVGGTSTDPLQYRGKYSALARFQEQILTGMYRRAIAGVA